MRAFVIQRITTLVTIGAVVDGCDKAKGFIGGDQPAPPEIAPGGALNLAARPDILFQIFGEKEDPRMIPIAAIEDGQLKKIVLSSSGWHQFDAMYLRKGKTYKLYQDGRPRGTATVRQGMWERPETPLYTLPGCQALTPLASIAVTGLTKSSYTVEALAASFDRPVARSPKPLPNAELARTGSPVEIEAGAPDSGDSRMCGVIAWHADT